MTSTTAGYLHLPHLPKAACKAHIFPGMHSSLLSIGQLCNHGCDVHFSEHKVTINLHARTLMTGTRHQPTGMWHVNLPPPPTASPPHQAHSAMATESVPERIAFLHLCAGSPALSTFCAAIDAGYFTTWPELTAARVRRHLSPSVATIQGHLDQQRQNLRSTKTKKPKIFPGQDELQSDIQPRQNEQRCHHVYLECQAITGQIYSDQPGQFLCPSTKGNKYIMVAYDYDSNAHLVQPMTSRKGPALLTAYQRIHATLTSRGLKPQYQILDNEASDEFKRYLSLKNIDYQLTPVGTHRRNAAERAIRTFKNHFIAILCGTDPDFPLRLWDRLLPQAEITLNLLRGSRINPQLSAHAQLHGAFDFNRTPLGPLGTRVIVHELPTKRGTWSPHGVPGWYVGPALNHYRCYTVYITETSGERIANTLIWKPTLLPMPKTSSADAATYAARELIHALQHPAAASPLAPITDEHQKALTQLADIFRSQAPTEPVPPTVTNTPSPACHAAPRVSTEQTYTMATRNQNQVRRQKAQHRKLADHPPVPSPRVTPTPVRNRFAPLATPPTTTSPPAPSTIPRFTPTTRVPASHSHNTRTRAAHQSHALAAILFNPIAKPNAHRDHFVNAVIDPITGASLEYRHLLKGTEAKRWIQANVNEIGRLTDGRVGNNVTGSNTLRFISIDELPSDYKAIYLRVVAAFRPQKEDPYRIRWTCGGNLVVYNGIKSTPNADIATAKILFNSTISTKNGRFMCMDIKDFYLGTPLPTKEYMWVPVTMLTEEVIAAYNLRNLIVDGRVLVEISKGMYGLPQAGRMAYDLLVTNLAPFGYTPCRHTPGLWRHHTRAITFALVVDDFGVKYVNKADAEHLLHALRTQYRCTTDWDGALYCGITLKWDYNLHTVQLSMPTYIKDALHKFKHPLPYRPEHAPHDWTAPAYGQKTQLAPSPDDSALLDTDGITRIQQIVGTLLYYCRAIDSTALVAVNAISAEQSHATEQTNKKITRLLNYFATHPDAILRYSRSDMVLHVHSDAAYLVAPKARSRYGGHFFLGSASGPQAHNGAILANASIIKPVVSSAAEAEIAGCFHNCQDALPLRTALHEMGHPQPPTPVSTDNSTAAGIANRTIKQRRSKAIDMRYYWLQDRAAQDQFSIQWAPGKDNRADYNTKHFSVAHHQEMRPLYLFIPELLRLAHCLRGCVAPRVRPRGHPEHLSANPSRLI